MIKKIINQYKALGFVKTVCWLFNAFTFRIKKFFLNISNYSAVKITEKEKDFVMLKDRPNIFIVANVPYYDIGGGQRCSQLAKTFNSFGYNVEYLYAFKSGESLKFNLTMPISAHSYINAKNMERIKSRVSKNDLFIFESPCEKFNPVLDLAVEKECKIIYENIDNWETSLGSGVCDEETLKRLLTESTILVGTSMPLKEQLEQYLEKYHLPKKPVMYLANAVDSELFCRLKSNEPPKDLVKGRVTLLYYGSLWGEWFDWDIITELAQRHSDYSFNLIGDHANIGHIKRQCPDNVHFLGLKKQSELPAYLSHVDYALVPFKTGEIGDYVSPLKIFEYISMGTKVLCTELPEVKGYPNVYCGNSSADWEAAIEADHTVDIDAADSFILDNSWANRITEMIHACYPETDRSILNGKLSVVILNYNNKNVIFRCINTLIKFNELYNYEIIVVDNGSKDGSYEELLKKYGDTEVVILQNGKNGCSSGRNLGISAAHGEYVIFLDSDQWVTNKYWLMPYENILKTGKNIGLIGWAAGWFNGQGYAHYTVDNFRYKYMPPVALCRNDIGYLGTGGMIVKKAILEKVGGFDLKYDPTCYEDTDLSLAVRNEGLEIYYCAYLGVAHLPHQTTKSGTEHHDKLIKEKGDYFVAKWKDKNPDLLKYIK